MVYLPNEIINLILSFREINPVSLLIKESVKNYAGNGITCSIFDNYYKHAIMKAQENIYISSYCKTQKFYFLKDKDINSKKLTKKKKNERKDRCYDMYKKLTEQYKEKYESFLRRLSGDMTITYNREIYAKNGVIQ